MLNLSRSLKILGLGFVSSSAFAAGVPLSDVAETLMMGGDALTKVMWAACILVGVMLIAAAFTQFQIHRRNSKLVPLTTPVLYLILGIVSIAIPFIERVSGFLDDSNPSKTPAATQRNINVNDIDAPIN